MHILNEHTVAQHLVARGILAPQCLLDPDTRIYRVSRRHQSYAVLDRGGSGFFVKQDGDASGFGSVAHEASVYQLLHAAPELAPVARRVPLVVGRQAGASGVLVLRWLPNSSDLFASFANLEPRQQRIAGELGALFADLHGAGARADVRHRLPCHCVPQGLDLHLPSADMVWSASPAGLALIRLLQQHAAFAAGMNRVRDAWTADAPIHFDVKLANLLIGSAAGNADPAQVTLIDWEYAGLGDPRWDIGSLFAGFLDLWLASTLPCEGLGPQPAPIAFARIQQMLRDIWTSYQNAIGAPHCPSLEQVLQFTAARLVHSAFELALERSALDPRITALLQLALNIFRQPQRVVRDLMDCAAPAAAGAGR